MNFTQGLLALANHSEDDPVLLPLALNEPQPTGFLRHELALPLQEFGPIDQFLPGGD